MLGRTGSKPQSTASVSSGAACRNVGSKPQDHSLRLHWSVFQESVSLGFPGACWFLRVHANSNGRSLYIMRLQAHSVCQSFSKHRELTNGFKHAWAFPKSDETLLARLRDNHPHPSQTRDMRQILPQRRVSKYPGKACLDPALDPAVAPPETHPKDTVGRIPRSKARPWTP